MALALFHIAIRQTLIYHDPDPRGAIFQDRGL